MTNQDDLPVQVAFVGDEAIMFGRDKDTGEHAAIVWTREEWRELLAAIKRGELDPLEGDEA